MKKLLGTVALLASLAFSSAQASIISGVEFGEGPVSIVSNVYFNTTPADLTGTTPIPDQNLISQGVGQVLEIRNETDVIWSATGSGVEFNFFFDNIKTDYLNGPFIGNNFLFGDILGEVSFFSNTSGTFAPTGDYATDSAAIAGGDLLLYGIGHPVDGYTIIGASDDDSNSGTGQLDIWSGAAFDLIVQDQLIRSDGSLADMTFNFSADSLQTNGYTWSGSADFGTVTKVPEPSVLGLMGIGAAGLLGMGGFRRRA